MYWGIKEYAYWVSEKCYSKYSLYSLIHKSKHNTCYPTHVRISNFHIRCQFFFTSYLRYSSLKLTICCYESLCAETQCVVFYIFQCGHKTFCGINLLPANTAPSRAKIEHREWFYYIFNIICTSLPYLRLVVRWVFYDNLYLLPGLEIL